MSGTVILNLTSGVTRSFTRRHACKSPAYGDRQQHHQYHTTLKPVSNSQCRIQYPVLWLFSLRLRFSRWYCCDRKSRAAYVQSFALWQQATIEFTCHDHSSRTLLLRSIVDIVSITRDYTPRSLLLLVRATYMYGVVLHAHPVRGESHI